MIVLSIGNVAQRFELLSGIDSGEADKWRILIDEACDYVNSRIKKETLTDYDRNRIDTLSAVYAYKLYCMSSCRSISSFKAGEVTVTSSADETKRAESLWQDYLQKYDDLISGGSFLFGRVRA